MIKQFSIEVSKTINLGDYNSIRVGASLVIALAEGEDYAKSKDLAQQQLRSLLEETYKAQRKDAP